jgi:hypothetical protein
MAGWSVGGRRGLVLARVVAMAAVGIAVSVEAPAAVPTIESLPLAATYGNGVHSYFAGDYSRSYEDLSQAIEAGTTDPRAWYFRGLAALKLGRLDEAEADFAAGAAREADGVGAWPIGRSLERVQGCDRLKLERHRVRARVASVAESHRRNELRYLERERAEPEVLRRRRPTTVRPQAEGNPFEEGDAEAVPAAEPAAEAPAEEMPEPAADGGEAPAGESPFGADAGAAGSAKSEQVEELAAEREDVAEQRDQQAEVGAAEVEDAAGQRDQQAEMEAVR